MSGGLHCNMSSTSELQYSADGGPYARKVEKKVEFTSTFSMVVTLLGFSIGMADAWRFPFLVYRNGGGKLIVLHYEL